MKRTSILASLLVGTAVILSGCCCSDHHDEENCNPGKAPAGATVSPAGTVNLYCVVVPRDLIGADAATTEWRGEKVGFCCSHCVTKWNKMTESERDTKVAAAKIKNTAP